MKFTIEMSEKDEALLAVKEIQRQFQAQREDIGDEAIEQYLSSDLGQQVYAIVAGLREGQISPAEAEAQGEVFERQFEEQLVDGSDDPALVMSHRAEKEAAIKGLGEAAQLLVHSAHMRAAEGLSKEEWIAEVLNGHTDDDAAQLGSLAVIVKLWSEGLLPWPAGGEEA